MVAATRVTAMTVSDVVILMGRSVISAGYYSPGGFVMSTRQVFRCHTRSITDKILIAYLAACRID
jgi:hypothetical protein